MKKGLEKLLRGWMVKTKDTEKLPKEKFIVRYKKLDIGELTRDENNKYVFKYAEAFKKQYKEGKEKDDTYIRKITEFSDIDKTYKSSDLYPFFVGRIPDPNRPIIKEIVEEEGVDPTDPLALLHRFAREALDDPFIVEKQVDK